MGGRIMVCLILSLAFWLYLSHAVEEHSPYLYIDDPNIQELASSADLQTILDYLASGNGKATRSNNNDELAPPPPTTTLGTGKSLRVSSDAWAYLVIYYAEWCPHCHRSAKISKKIAARFSCSPDILFFAFECSRVIPGRVGEDGVIPGAACRAETVQGFPTMILYWSAASSPRPILSPAMDSAENFALPGGSNSELLYRSKIPWTVRSVDDISKWISNSTQVIQTQCPDEPKPTSAVAEADQRAAAGGIARWASAASHYCPDIRLHDAYVGLLYLLRNWVLRGNEDLNEKRSAALQGLLKALAPLLPGRNVQVAIHQLYVNLNREGSMTAQAYQTLVDNLSLGGVRPMPAGVEPVLLSGGTVASATWLLFHTMTVSLYSQKEVQTSTGGPQTTHNAPSEELRGGASELSQPPKKNDEDEIGEVRSVPLNNEPPQIISSEPQCAAPNLDSGTVAAVRSPYTATFDPDAWDVASSIYATVSNFFGCEVCRVHFTTFFAQCYADLCTWVRDAPPDHRARGLVIWLWRFHNAVTFRTAVEKTADGILEGSSQQGVESYIREDVRFPPTNLCRPCRRSPEQFGDSDNFRVSEALLQQAVAFEKMLRGDGPPARPIPDSAWDQIEDFDLTQIASFLLRYYWRPQWSNMLGDLYWDNATQTFSSFDLGARRLLGGVLLSNNLRSDQHLFKAAAEAAAAPAHLTTATSGAFWIAAVATVAAIVAYAKRNSKPEEVLRSLGVPPVICAALVRFYGPGRTSPVIGPVSMPPPAASRPGGGVKRRPDGGLSRGFRLGGFD